jgi:predicted transposase/invertase (TIGR01784 family)
LIEKWVYFIKNAESLTVMPSNLDDEGLKSAYQEADRHTWNKKDIEAYEYERMRETDEKAEKMLVEEKAKMKIAKKLVKRNLSNEDIAEDTGLTVEQVEQLRNEISE